MAARPRPNSVKYGNSKTTTLLPSAKCTRPLFQGRTGCGGRPSGWHDIVTCQRLVYNGFFVWLCLGKKSKFYCCQSTALTYIAISKLSLSLIHNTIGLGLPMFINPTTRQQISIYSIGPYWYLFACTCTPTLGKVWGYNKIFCSLAPLANPVLYPHLKIRGAAPAYRRIHACTM